ncbi:hypothetical protein [Oceanobacillus sp. FSL H7-0719]|uniref:hypothetical protein n=1 Tax=Oceanobacillus sp. FSL H7-0719 TaxID=2954507 RepID=UPI0032454CE6
MKINKNTKLGEIVERLNSEKKNKEFDDLYNEYRDTLEDFSGGLATTNKSDFLKMYTFFVAVSEPHNRKYWEAYLGKELK